MVVNDEINVVRRRGQVRRLKVHDSDSIEFAESIFGDLLDFNLEQLHHRDILGPCNPPERPEWRSLLVASQNLTQSQTGGNGIGIGVILE